MFHKLMQQTAHFSTNPMQELENVGIRLNRKPPDVSVRPTKGGGALTNHFVSVCVHVRARSSVCSSVGCRGL